MYLKEFISFKFYDIVSKKKVFLWFLLNSFKFLWGQYWCTFFNSKSVSFLPSFLVQLAKDMLILLVFLRTKFWVSSVLFISVFHSSDICRVCSWSLFSACFGLVCPSFASYLRCKLNLLIWCLSFLLMKACKAVPVNE